MKNYIICLLTALVLVLPTSCQKALDAQDDGRITFDVIFGNQYKIEAYYNTCYAPVVTPNLASSAYTDEAQQSDYFSNLSVGDWYNGLVNTARHPINTFGGDPWSTLYSYIRKCNVFLKNIPNETANMNPDAKAGFTAEIHALRAYYYWQLAKRYGGVPIFDEALATNHDYSKDKRASFSDVVRFILADCEKALQGPDVQLGFPWGYFSRVSGRVNRATVYALMSEAVTYAASPLWSDGSFTWTDATNINGRALSELLSHGYELFNSPDASAQNAYALYFLLRDDTRATDKETIYRAGSGPLSIWNGAGLPTNPAMTSAGQCPTQNLVDSYEMKATGEPIMLGYADVNKLQPIANPASGYDPQNPYVGRDPRMDASIYYNGSIRFLNNPAGKKVETFVGGLEGIRTNEVKYTPTGYYLRKYNNYTSANNANSDGTMRMFRLAEVYLNFAESANQSHGADVKVNIGNNMQMSAADAVNATRSRAGMPAFPVGLSKADFDKKYRNERRVELAFEGHRPFDLRRWKALNEEEVITGMNIVKSGTTLTYNRFNFPNRKSITDKFLIFPINLGELYKVKENTGQNWQNPGWDF